MTWFDGGGSPPVAALSDRQVAHLRQTLRSHANQPATGECGSCAQRSCAPWRAAYDRLAEAGRLMAERWNDTVEDGAR